MTTPNTLHDLATRALRALDEDDWPQLKDDLRLALNQEDTAAALHQFCLAINYGGLDDFNVYFSIESGNTPDEWVVSEGIKCFYKGVEITALFEGSDIDELIYANSNKVEDMMSDLWAEAQIDRYEASRED
jgi:hypothetical protein